MIYLVIKIFSHFSFGYSSKICIHSINCKFSFNLKEIGQFLHKNTVFENLTTYKKYKIIQFLTFNNHILYRNLQQNIYTQFLQVLFQIHSCTVCKHRLKAKVWSAGYLFQFGIQWLIENLRLYCCRKMQHSSLKEESCHSM